MSFPDVNQLILLIPALIIAITVHEFSHAKMAEAMGDPTARLAGRVSLNPIRHLDPVGSLMLFLVHFGWGKPVPIDAARFRNPRVGMMLVSLAGPGSNFVTAAVFAMVLRVAAGFISAGSPLITGLYVGVVIVEINILLGVFNLLPIPPLDGSKIVAGFMPKAWLPKYLSVEHYGTMVLFIAIVFFGSAVSGVLRPVQMFLLRLLLPV